MKPSDQRRVIDITDVQVFGVEKVMGLIDAQAKRGGNRQPDKGKKSD
jgi:hypothetical protein